MTPYQRWSFSCLIAALVACPVRAQEPVSAEDIIVSLTSRGGFEAVPRVALTVEFRLGSDELTDVARRQVAELAKALRDPRLVKNRYELGGHTDATGSAAMNRELSSRRAQAVKNELGQLGVAAGRLTAVGYGFDRLRDTANPASPVNRRVEVLELSSTTPQ